MDDCHSERSHLVILSEAKNLPPAQNSRLSRSLTPRLLLTATRLHPASQGSA